VASAYLASRHRPSLPKRFGAHSPSAESRPCLIRSNSKRDVAISRSRKCTGQRHRPKYAWLPFHSLHFPSLSRTLDGVQVFLVFPLRIFTFTTDVSSLASNPSTVHFVRDTPRTPCSSSLLENYRGPKDNTTQALAISRVVANSNSGKHLLFLVGGYKRGFIVTLLL
jgi:hypothetical protein